MTNTYDARVLADSESPCGSRLTTLEVTFPRFILAEVNTHRMLSRNSASSRAIPTEKQIARVTEHPFVPAFNKRVTGMGVGEPLSEREQAVMEAQWLKGRDVAVEAAYGLLGVDKSRANRLLEPFMWHTAIISGTEWGNFFALRDHEDAQPEFRIVARKMREAMENSTPRKLKEGEWHLPLIYPDEYFESDMGQLYHVGSGQVAYGAFVSAGRCARVSFDTHHKTERPNDSVERWVKLSTSGHWSPAEHPARARDDAMMIGNFRGFTQLRKFYAGEEDFSHIAA